MRESVEKRELPTAPCVHESCSRMADISMFLKGKVRNVCLPHYEFHQQRAAQAFVASLGFDQAGQQERKMGWIRERMDVFREPGTWWAQQILDRHVKGEPVAFRALEMARAVVDESPRTPGEDDE